jgi:GTP-binding protein EngB required for normal cell division
MNLMLNNMNNKPSLLIIGNSNVGKTSITKLLLPNPNVFKGKIGKDPGSTLLIKPITQPNLPYQIVDMPGFGYMKGTSQRRMEHIKTQIVIHVEKHHENYFLGLIILSVLRIEDEIIKYSIQNQTTIPLSFELIQFLSEFNIPLIVILNKIDKITNIDKERLIPLLIDSAKGDGINLVHIDKFNRENKNEIPFLEFSAVKKINLGKLKQMIEYYFRKNSK